MNWTEEDYHNFLNRKTPGIKKVKKKSKYSNIKTMVDGIQFDSRKEADYYCQLKLLKRAGEIREFGLQPRYELQPTFKKDGTTHRSITYVADFLVVNNDGTTDVIDVKASKSFQTPVYRIKKKMFEYKYPELRIVEIY